MFKILTSLLLLSPLLIGDTFKKVKPILEQHCLSCHNTRSKLINGGNLSLETLKDALKGGFRGPSIIKSNPEESLIYKRSTLPDNNPLAMPPRNRYRALNEKELKIIYNWIANSAPWDKEVVLKAPRINWDKASKKELALIKKIHSKIVATAKREKQNFKSYEERQYNYSLKMIPVKGGRVTLQGKEDNDKVEVKVSDFWMSATEITWELFSPFMTSEISRHKDGSPSVDKKSLKIDEIIARPTPPYHAMNFGMPIENHPAIGMTQHSANKFCQWLSYKTGHFYRLPTQAEWEYAARAGAKSTFAWGEKAQDADNYAWYEDNSNGQYQQVATKKPNAWGFYDMYGNVAEWTLDQYVDNLTKHIGRKRATNLWVKATNPYPHVTKGGHWDAGINSLKVGATIPSDPEWKASDPQFPKSIWYMTDISWCGMRIVRSKKIPTVEEMYAYWNSGVAYDD